MNDQDFATWFAGDFRPLVAAVTAVCGSRRAAEDAVAEAFTKAYARRREVAAMRAPSAWVYRVAVNDVRMTWRRKLHERRWDHLQSTVVVEPPDKDAQLWDAVAALPRRQREVVALRYLASYTQEEIAQALGIAPGTVASTLHDARSALGRVLNRTDTPDAHTR
jgi:RNA polymerase sigma-70 factor (ECF subfamily)